MRIGMYSDLHLEFEGFEPPELDVDVLVLAGDIAPKLRGLRWAEALPGDFPIVYVAGNHEFYGTNTHLPDKLRRLASERVHVLSDRAVTLGGVRFLGATLWTDLALNGDPEAAFDVGFMLVNDFRKIRNADLGYRRFRPSHALASHRASRKWLAASLGEPHSGPTVVVTHHPPSPKSMKTKHVGKSWAPYDASAMDDFVADSGAALWIHGHTHHVVDYTLGATRVVGNMRGYPGHRVPGFDEYANPIEV